MSVERGWSSVSLLFRSFLEEKLTVGTTINQAVTIVTQAGSGRNFNTGLVNHSSPANLV
jgi:hypothetical protein